MSAIKIRVPKTKHYRSLARREPTAAIADAIRRPPPNVAAAIERLRLGEGSIRALCSDALTVWVDSGNDPADFKNSKELRSLLRDLWPIAFADVGDRSFGSAIRRAGGAEG